MRIPFETYPFHQAFTQEKKSPSHKMNVKPSQKLNLSATEELAEYIILQKPPEGNSRTDD